MDLDIRQSGNVCALKVKGRLVCGPDATTFTEAVTQAISAGSPHLVLDLSAMNYVDSSGIGAVVSALRQTHEHGGDVRLVNLSKFAENSFKMVGILKLFQVFPSEEEALQSYS